MCIVKDFPDKTAFIWRDFCKIRGVMKHSFLQIGKNKGKRIEICPFWRHKKGVVPPENYIRILNLSFCP